MTEERRGKFVRVASVKDVPVGRALQVDLDDRMIALFNTGSGFFALDDTCPHRDGPLSEGVFDGDSVTCPWHGARFCLRDGALLSPPAVSGVRAHPLRVVDDQIEVLIS